MRNALTLFVTILAIVLLFTSLANPGPATAQTAGTPTPLPTTAPDDDSGVQDLPPLEGKLNPPRYPKMDSHLNRIVEQVQTRQSTAQAAAASAPIHREESVAVTLYVTEGYARDVWDWLEESGGDPRNIGIDYIEAYVPVPMLPQASQQEGVISVRTIIPPQPAQGVVVSEGAALHGAIAWHDAGFTGQNVKIGIIDRGYLGYHDLAGTELPANVQVLCFPEMGVSSSNVVDCNSSDDPDAWRKHGTGSTEVVFDIAPDATYYLTNDWSSPGDLRTAVNWMISNGVDVINASVGWGWDGPGDGTSPHSNSVLKSIDVAVSGGALWVNSAGNQALTTWFGPFDDPDGDGYHNFLGNDECNAVNVYADFPFVAAIRWEDAWGGASIDLDLHLVDELGNVVLSSEDFQDGSSASIPLELVDFLPENEGTYCLSIRDTSGSARPEWIQLQAWQEYPLEHATLSGSIVNGAESANPGMLAVGAAWWEDASIIESYSSRGPTTDGRIKPDIVGATGGRTVSYRSEDNPEGYYGGTSGSSPHIAGLAALVKQRFPQYSPQQIAEYLKDNAEPRPTNDPILGPSAHPNNTWGYGFARLPPPDGSPLTPIPTPTPSPDRAALVALYDATDGDNWTDKDNWLSDEPVGDWQGVTTDDEGRVTEIHLWGNNLRGSIPSELGNLSNLVLLDFYSNDLSGPVPPELGNLSNLTILELGRNRLTGEIPAELGNLTDLGKLSFSGNQLTGEIPPKLGNLSSLRELYLRENGLTGEIPSDLGGLIDLETMALEANQLTGQIPYSLVNLTNLERLWLTGNDFTGCVPEALHDVPDNDLQDLDLPDCDGAAPVECLHDCQLLLGVRDVLVGDNDAQLNWDADLPISDWTGVEVDSEQQVTHLILSESGLSGSIPSLLGDLHGLRELELWGNSLTGEIPSELGDLSDLIVLDLSGNQLSGEIPTELGDLSDLVFLALNANELSGAIPAEMGSMSSLTELYLWENQLSGEIPVELGNLVSLTRLELARNELTGEIPTELAALSNLETLSLWGNQLSGEIPAELGNFSNLEILSLSSNQLDGEIPAALGNLTSLTELYLGGNQLSGEIPSELGNLPNLTELSAWGNQLSGEIPPELSNLAELEHLSLAGNQLSGEIPAQLGDLSRLRSVSFSRNRLSGEIPSELGRLSNLEQLYLYNNQLSGDVPSELLAISGLRILALFGNQLSGGVPEHADEKAILTTLYNSTGGTGWKEKENWASTEPVFTWTRVIIDSSGHVTALWLDDNQLTGEIPQELSNLVNLEALYLAGNQLAGCIPKALREVEFNDFADTGLPFCEEEPADPCATTLTGPGAVDGRWEDACPSTNRSGSYAHYYTFTLNESSEVTIALESSVDTVLYLLRSAGRDGAQLADNDDHADELDCAANLGSDTDSCITESLDAGDYTIEATTHDPEVTGDFTLTVSGLPDVAPDCTGYSESPDLAEKVASGELPSVCDRLPSEPLTVQTLDDTGEYGGMLRRFYLGPADSCNFFRVSRASLVRFSQDGFSLLPSVARDWEMSEDGKEWTFHLREGMKWSDGNDFTADDFIWQYENVILNEELTPYTPAFLGIGNETGSIEKVDDTTVKFVFPQPNFLFAETAAQADEACYGASRNVPWAPSHYMQQFHIDHNPDLEQEAQDAGFSDWVDYYDDRMQYRLNPDKPTIAPWRFTNPLGDQVVVSERNPYFWAVDEAGNQLPYLDGIRTTLVESAEAGTQSAIRGEIDLQGRHIRLDQYIPLREGRADGGYTVLTWPTFGGTDLALFFNMSLPGATGEAIRTKEFRQALSLAIDRKAIQRDQFLGFGETRQNVPPPGHPHYPDDDIAKLRTEYDVEEANALLDSVFPDKDDEGFRLSNGERIVMSVTVTDAFGPWPDAARAVGRAWEVVGVKTDVDQTSSGEHFDRWYTNEWAVMVWNEDTTGSTFSSINKRAPENVGTFHGPGCGAWLDDPENPVAVPCLQESLDLLEMHRRGPGLPEAERNALGQEIYRTLVENQYSIGIVGLSPMVQGVVVKKNTLHNVPDAAANDWTFRTPSSAFPEQWYFGPEVKLVEALPSALSVGSSHACALDPNGVISCQGVDDSAQVTGPPASGVFTVISVGMRHSCAIDLGGRVHCWGSDEHGQVSGRPTSGEFIAVGAGARHTCAIDARGSLHCWGSDDHGQSSPPAEGEFVAVGAGESHTCGLLSDGTLECWGVFSRNSP